MEEVRREADQMAEEGRQPTEFELVCAAAFVWFAREQCEVVVLEAGIGGRLDSTNIVRDTLAAMICSIGLDHVEVLGDTPAKIAAEKCGVLRPGIPCICYPDQDLDAPGCHHGEGGRAELPADPRATSGRWRWSA